MAQTKSAESLTEFLIEKSDEEKSMSRNSRRRTEQIRKKRRELLLNEHNYTNTEHLSLDSDDYDLINEHDEPQQKTHEETCEERIKGATIGFLIAICVSLLAYNLTLLFPSNTDCPMSRFSCRKEHFLKVYKSIRVVDKFRDTNRRKILSSVKEQMAEPPDEPLVILIMVDSTLISKEEFYPFVHSLVSLPRGQKFSTSVPADIKSEKQFQNFLTENLSQNKSVIVDDLNDIPASKVIKGLYGLDYNSPSKFKDKTIVLIYKSDKIDRNSKDDQIATRTLTNWILKDETVKIGENKGLISRIANIPLIMC